MLNRIDCYNLGKCFEFYCVVRYLVFKGMVFCCGILYDWFKWIMDFSIEVYYSFFYLDFYIIWYFRLVDWMFLMFGVWILVFFCEFLGLFVVVVYILVW